jgi:hypothetical protein
MSASHSATLIVGTPFENIFKQVEVDGVPKFNPDTGARYIPKVKKWTICGKVIEEETEDPRHYPEEYLRDTILSAVQDTNYENERHPNHVIIGVIIEQASGDGQVKDMCEFGDGKVSAAVQAAKEALTELGYTGPVRLYLVATVSY